MTSATAPIEIGRTGDSGAVSCRHCGLPVPPGETFCCTGCATAHAIVNDLGLSAYYRFSERRGEEVRASGRAFAEFDHDSFTTTYVRDREDGLSEVELYLEHVHCPSCVWLVEKVSLTIPGVTAAELDIGRARARVVWDRSRTPLSAVARTLDTLGYIAHPFRGGRAEEARRAEDRAALVGIGVSGAIAGNVMMIALAIYAGWFGGIEREFERYFRWWSFLLTTPSLLWPGRVFFRSAWGALRRRSLHMDVPIALALGAAFVHGAVNTVRDAGPVYFDGVAALVFLLLVGRYLQQRAQRAAIDSSELLHSLAPATARVIEGAATREVPAEAVLPGWLVEVRAGDTLPADGIVESGDSSIDLSLLTGESRPVSIGAGDTVFAGTTNMSSPLRVRVTRSGESSRLGALMRDVADSARRRSPIVRLADRLAGRFILAVLTLATLAFVIWVWRDPAQAFDNAIAMLVVTCPCALALATPLTVTGAMGKAARGGILIRGGDALEILAGTGTIVLDKTGTVTEGRMALVGWRGSDDALSLLAALEKHSRHPLAAAIAAAETSTTRRLVTKVAETIGGGIQGRVDGRQVVAGTAEYIRTQLGEPSLAVPCALAGHTEVIVAIDGTIAGVASIGDPVRAGAAEVIASLQRSGWRVELLSGDRPDVVTAVGQSLGLSAEDARGGATPEAKRDRVRELARVGPVVMVGDGVNDAPAMAGATASIGVHGGAEACLRTSDVFLSRPGLEALGELVRGARRTMTLVRAGFLASIAYNVAGASLVLAGLIDPLIAAILMPASSLSVIFLAWKGPTFAAGEPGP